jgi:transcriptional regulator with GAF, ATPase, and Fis domain
MSLNDLSVLIKSALDGRQRLDSKLFRETKKRLIERQCQGLLEFIEPKWKLDTVIGHEAAKERLRDDARLLSRGALDCVAMGYLICGPVGTGKSFLAMCAAAGDRHSVRHAQELPLEVRRRDRRQSRARAVGAPRDGARSWSSSTRPTPHSATVIQR